MVVTDKFVFLHLQKCGGSFIRDYILNNIPNSVMVRPQHDGYDKIKGKHINKPIIGIIRNPWDWYVSVYHYHKPSKGSFMEPLIKEGGSFKGFLKLFLNKDDGKIHNLNFNWMGKMNVGPYTYRVVRTFNDKGLKIESIDDMNLKKVELIKMENLVPNFKMFLDKNNIKLSKSQLVNLENKPKVNTSNRTHYSNYYDEETIDLVLKKDNQLINLFGYEFEYE
jgi:hypothetical protein